MEIIKHYHHDYSKHEIIMNINISILTTTIMVIIISVSLSRHECEYQIHHE